MRHEPHTPVPQLAQRIHRALNARIRIRNHRRHRIEPLHGTVDEHQRQVTVDDRPDTRGIGALRHHDGAIDALAEQRGDERVLPLHILGGRADQRTVPLLVQLLLHRGDQVGEERVADIRHQQTHRSGLGQADALRPGIRHITQLVHGLAHQFLGLVGETPFAMQNLRDSRNRHPPLFGPHHVSSRKPSVPFLIVYNSLPPKHRAHTALP